MGNKEPSIRFSISRLHRCGAADGRRRVQRLRSRHMDHAKATLLGEWRADARRARQRATASSSSTRNTAFSVSAISSSAASTRAA